MANFMHCRAVQVSTGKTRFSSERREQSREFAVVGKGEPSPRIEIPADATAIVVEQTLAAVHTGLWKALAPTGRRFELHVCTVYEFDDAGRLATERVYMDLGWLEHQLTHAKRRSRSASLT